MSLNLDLPKFNPKDEQRGDLDVDAGYDDWDELVDYANSTRANMLYKCKGLWPWTQELEDKILKSGDDFAIVCCSMSPRRKGFDFCLQLEKWNCFTDYAGEEEEDFDFTKYFFCALPPVAPSLSLPFFKSLSKYPRRHRFRSVGFF